MCRHLQALESEINSHEQLIESVAATAEKMINDGHYAAKDVREKLDDLLTQLRELKGQAAERRVKLLDAVESQMVMSTALLSDYVKSSYVSVLNSLRKVFELPCLELSRWILGPMACLELSRWVLGPMAVPTLLLLVRFWVWFLKVFVLHK